MKYIPKLSIILAIYLGSIEFVYASEIKPASYSFDKPTGVGTWSYHDDTGIQLMDDEYGIEPFGADLGNGPAYEWVGWHGYPVVNIDFNFGSVVEIDKIIVGTTQDWIPDVIVPNIGIFSSSDGLSWGSLISSVITPQSISNNYKYFSIELDNLGIVSEFIRVELSFSENGPWTFTDEIDFFGSSSSVSEPTTMAIFGFGLLGLFGLTGLKHKYAVKGNVNGKHCSRLTAA